MVMVGGRSVVVVPRHEGLASLASMPSTMRSSVGQGSCHWSMPLLATQAPGLRVVPELGEVA